MNLSKYALFILLKNVLLKNRHKTYTSCMTCTYNARPHKNAIAAAAAAAAAHCFRARLHCQRNDDAVIKRRARNDDVPGDGHLLQTQRNRRVVRIRIDCWARRFIV